MNDKYTSKELSKKLAEAGCGLESEYFRVHFINEEGFEKHEVYTGRQMDDEYAAEWLSEFPAYDILNDICVKYAKEFFGNKKVHHVQK